MPESVDCPRSVDCGNVDIYCSMCTGFSFYKKGKNQTKGSRHEKQVVKSRNTIASVRRGSGNQAHAKGDILDSLLLHEAKTGYTQGRGKGSFTVQRKWLLKIEDEAVTEGRAPVLDFKFDEAPEEEIWSIMRASTLFDLMEELQYLRHLNLS